MKFEDLEEKPIEQIRKVYQTLSLPGFEQAETAFQAYITSITGYQKNRYELTDDVIQTVNHHWQFALDAWGYPRL